MAGGFFRFLDSSSDWVGRDWPLFTDEEGDEPIVRNREPEGDEFALGYAKAQDETTTRPVYELFTVPQEHRRTHCYVVGGSGTGKTRFLETLAWQDVLNGDGFGVVDAGSDLTEDLKGYLYLLKKDEADFLSERVVLIDPADPDHTVCFNPLERTDGMDTDEVVGELMEVFEKIWADSWGNRMAALLRNSLTALVENDLTLAELSPFITNPDFRSRILENVQSESCREYFFGDFNTQTPKTQREWAESTLNKIGALLAHRKIRQMFVARKSTFSFREVMDGKKILLVKLDRGRLKGSADLLGSLLLAKIQMAAFARTDTLEDERVLFYLYVDEFQHFATDSFIETLSESRKYRLPLVLAHQQLAQLPPALRASLLANCKLQAYFNITRADADILAKEALVPIYQNPPGWEGYIQLLQRLLPRECVVKNKNNDTVARIVTRGLEKPHEIAGTSAAAFASAVADAQIGSAYLRPRAEVEAEYRARRESFSEAAETPYKQRKRS
ncbi:MAG: type IV secretion system DNA-binding domain-containing protein [Patescibacteria group bacterium]|nr:type IV secretion system DNA-binding domain-containing protein [Patescibacteria group bacterium]